MQFHIYKPETTVRGDVRIYLHVPLTSCFLCLVIVIGLFTTRKRIFTLQVIEHNMIDCTIQMICTWVRCQIKWPFFHVASCLDRILKVCFGLHKIISSCPKWHGRIMLLCFTVIFRYNKLQMNKTIHTYKTPHSSSAEVRQKSNSTPTLWKHSVNTVREMHGGSPCVQTVHRHDSWQEHNDTFKAYLWKSLDVSYSMELWGCLVYLNWTTAEISLRRSAL